ncbi:MAG TPA: S9 family peptidase [Thermoanaerobaculia bacterium]|nr:S9 family peptidase [Thermoanaerobaculia bacterium]
MPASPRPAAPPPPPAGALVPRRPLALAKTAALLALLLLLPPLPGRLAPTAAALAAPAAPAAPSAAAAPAAPAAQAAPPAGGELEAAVTRMARIAGCWSPSFSPDALSLAFVSNQSGVPQVWKGAADGVRQERITSLDDPVGLVEWSPDGRFLAFTVAPGGGMNSQIYLMRPDGQQLARAGGPADDVKSNNLLHGFSHDGRLLLLSSNRADPASLDPFTYEPATGAWRRVAPGGGDGRLSDVSRDGRYALVVRTRQRGDEDVSIVDLHTGREALLTPHQPPASFDDALFAPDGMTVYLASNRDRDLLAFARIRLVRSREGEPPMAAAGGAGGAAGGGSGGIEVLAARDDAELDAFKLTADGHTAALLWNLAGRSQLSFLDLDTLRQEPGPVLPGEIVRDMAFSRNGRLLALTIHGARLPLDIWVVDRASGRLRQVTHAAHDGVDLGTLVSPELVHFPADDGLELSGWLYRPPRPSPPPGPPAPGPPELVSRPAPEPFVIMFHGGPESQERPHFDALYQALLARGIGVFAPNVRGSAGFGKRFVNLDNGPLRAGAVRDIRAAVEYLVRAGIADPKRIGIAGGSYGGYMTLAGLTEFPELFAAGADLYGIVDFETFFAHTEPWMAAISKVEYGDPATQRDLLRALSPIHKLDRVRAPILVLHGANDTNVPVIEAEQVVRALERRAVPVQYVLFPDEGHGFRKIANRIRATVAIVRWFETWLAPGGAAAPAGRPAPAPPPAATAAPRPANTAAPRPATTAAPPLSARHLAATR